MKFSKILRKLFKLDPEANLTDSRVIWKNIGSSDPQLHEINLNVTNKVKTSRYEIWNFLPLSLFDQFKRVVNLYFLCLIIVLLSLQKRAPVSPFTTILPLAFVVCVTLAKQAYEDYNRHKSDNTVNRTPVLIAHNGAFELTPAEAIRLGDVVRVNDGEEFPCDMVLLSSSNPRGECYITTANFDGETNLKLRSCVSETINMTTASELEDFSCIIECEHPNVELYRFNGTLTHVSDTTSVKNIPLNLNNFLLRGAQLRNTDYIMGVAVFTGPDTKMNLNQQKKRRKMSIVDRKLNHFILLMIIILFCGSTMVTVMHYSTIAGRDFWYLDKSYFETSLFNVFVDIASFIGLLNHLIPISLYVTLEIQKFAGAFFIDWDLDMYHMQSDDPARANTSDTLEELGQVEYLFTDKTGTLTENKMVFKKCVIGNDIYKKKEKYLESKDLVNFQNLNTEALEFFLFVCICHTAEAHLTVSSTDSNVEVFKYTSPSPDEAALLEAAQDIGIVYEGKIEKVIGVRVDSCLRNYKVLHTLEFDPDRKRMSVIFENEAGDIYLICKGADSTVLPLSKSSQKKRELGNYVDKFACEGHRTLVFAYKKINETEYYQIQAMLHDAETSILDRQQKLDKAFAFIESYLNLIGATAVDDHLQEGVFETIRDLREAGIKIWVLTGDKEETAISVSLKCGHFSPSMKLFNMCTYSNQSEFNIEEILHQINRMKKNQYALVINGDTISKILTDFGGSTVKLFEVASTVLCCRLSPIQKAKIVNFVRKRVPYNPITLAIGDGANDCSMIQVADVGVGVMGQEGRQAVYCSDFAIHRFRYLKKLLLFHGFNFYHRISHTILYFFYKNSVMCLPMFIFVWYTSFSPTSLYDDAEITMYNTLVTSMPVLVYGILEQPYTKNMLMQQPRLYRTISRNRLMSWRFLFFWLLNGLWQSLVIFYWSALVYNDGLINLPQQYFTFNVFGTMIYTYVVVCVTLQIQLLTRFWTLHTFVSTAGSLIYYVIGASFVSLLYSFDSNSSVFSIKFRSYFAFFDLLSFPHFWCGLFIVIPIAFFPYLIVTFFLQFQTSRMLKRTASHILEEIFYVESDK